MKARAELVMKGIGIVTDDREATTFLRPLRPERADDNVAAALHGPGHIPNVGDALFHRCQKMEHGPVVPEIVGGGIQFGARDVGNDPMNPASCFPYSFLANIDGSFGNVENGDVLMSPRQEIIGQCGFAPPTSMMPEEGPVAVRSMRARDVSRWGRYQLKASGAFVL